MATKKVKLHIPGSSQPVPATVEETIMISQVIAQLTRKEKLYPNRDYIITNSQGDEVSPSATFGSVSGSDFIIEESSASSPAAPTHESGGGFTGGDVSTPRSFHQLGILVLDGSGSMGEKTLRGMTKAEAVNAAVRGLLGRFKISGKVENFSFAIITFDNSAVIQTEITTAEDINDNGIYDPLVGHGGGTNIFEGLNLAGQVADDFMSNAVQGGVPHSVAIVVLSDGMCFEPDKTKQVADSLKAKGRSIFSAYLNGATQDSQSDAGKQLLFDIVSDKSIGFKEAWDAKTLRDFFVASLSTPSNSNNS